jgi:hypothetical protein
VGAPALDAQIMSNFGGPVLQAGWAGIQAAHAGQTATDCPYPIETPEGDAWLDALFRTALQPRGRPRLIVNNTPRAWPGFTISKGGPDAA